MTDGDASIDVEPTAVYEIWVQGGATASIRWTFLTATVLETRTETVLWRRLEEAAEFDELIDHLLSMTLARTEAPHRQWPSEAPVVDEVP